MSLNPKLVVTCSSGAKTETQTIAIAESTQTTVQITFKEIPINTTVTITAKVIATETLNGQTTEVELYAGSTTQKIAATENNISLTLKRVSSDALSIIIPTDIKGLTATTKGYSITFSVPESYSSYAWYLDDAVVSDEKASSWTLDTTSYENGYYYVMLVVTDADGNCYSAQYELKINKPIYTVAFDTNGGTSIAAQKYAYGTTFALPVLTKTGYTFAGWATTSNAETAGYPSGTNYTMGSADVTLYAIWVFSGSVGDIVYSDGTTSTSATYDSGKTAVGVVAFITNNKAYIVGLKQGSNLAWATQYESDGTTETKGYTTNFTEIQCTSSATGAGAASTATFTTENEADTDGSNNWEYICNQDSTGTASAATCYPAFNYANTYGTTASLSGTYATGWYMPSVAELSEVYKNKNTINTSLSAAGGTALGTNWYWSSSQNASFYYYAWDVYFGTGDVSNAHKNSNGFVLVIRAF